MTTRVAYVCADAGIPPDGSKGASVHFRELAAAFARLGIDLDVFFAKAGDVQGLRPHRAHIVPTPRAAGLAGELAQLGHANALLQALTTAGPHAAVYERSSLFGLAGLAHARALGVPFVVEVNAPLWREAAQFRGLQLTGTAQAVCLDVLRQADRVLAVSTALAEELATAGVPRARLQVFGNGADLRRFGNAGIAERPASLRGKPLLVFVGSLKPWHGVGFLLRAFAELRRQQPCGLWIVGDGPERDAVLAAAAALPDDIVHEGAVAHERIPGILRAANAVVAPYSATAPAYFSPLKVVEALAARRPLLAAAVPCVLDTLHGTPLPGLFAADDVDAFVAAAQRVLANGPAAIAPEPLVGDLDWTAKARRIAGWLGVAARPLAPAAEAMRG
ncbi:MAG: glycosyltransferase [Planctomycetes bacterium]|nr:glycosyltransferase [Planctomycetota bacterium]